MSSTVTTATASFLQSHAYESASKVVGIIIILMLTTLLVEKELLRAHGGPRAERGVAILDIAITPLLLAFVVVVIQRLLVMLAGAQ